MSNSVNYLAICHMGTRVSNHCLIKICFMKFTCYLLIYYIVVYNPSININFLFVSLYITHFDYSIFRCFIFYRKYVAEPKVHSVQSALPTYANTYSSKKLPITVPNYASVHHANHPKVENHRLDPQPSEIGESPTSNKTPQSPSTNYEQLIAHAAKVKFINNRYTTPITVELGSSESENSVNLPVKHRNIFIAIKLLDPSTSITIKDKFITNPLEFPIGTEYTESFEVITDQKNEFPRFFVHHDLHSILNVSAMKYGDQNIMSTFQSLRTWVNFNKFSTHRVASIGFLKYVSTGLTLYSTAKQRVINALLYVDLNETGIITLQECILITKKNFLRQQTKISRYAIQYHRVPREQR